VVVGVELDEGRIGDVAGEVASLRQRRDLVAIGVQYERRGADLRQAVADVDVAARLQQGAGVFSGRNCGITSSANKRIDRNILSYGKPGKTKNSK